MTYEGGAIINGQFLGRLGVGATTNSAVQLVGQEEIAAKYLARRSVQISSAKEIAFW